MSAKKQESAPARPPAPQAGLFSADCMMFADGTRAYEFDSAKACIFDPGVVFRVWRGVRFIDLILCFKCDEFEFEARDAAGELFGRGYEDFAGKSIDELAALAKQSFPEDAEIQAL